MSPERVLYGVALDPLLYFQFEFACYFTGSCTVNTSEFQNNDASHLQIRTAHFLIWKSHICKNVVEGESSKSSDGTQF